MFEFNEHTEWILGRPNFWCAQVIVPALRASGQDIAKKAEAEQAAAIYWMLQMYEKYGADWKEKGGKELKTMIEAAIEKAKAGENNDEKK